MNVLLEMTTLSMARPAHGAGKSEVAAWFEAKARLHEYIAAQGGADAGRENELAINAHRRSRLLLV